MSTTTSTVRRQCGRDRDLRGRQCHLAIRFDIAGLSSSKHSTQKRKFFYYCFPVSSSVLVCIDWNNFQLVHESNCFTTVIFCHFVSFWITLQWRATSGECKSNRHSAGGDKYFGGDAFRVRKFLELHAIKNLESLKNCYRYTVHVHLSTHPQF